MKTEELLKLIKLAGVEILNEEEFCNGDKNGNLIRDLKFKFDGVEYRIEWYVNKCTLYLGGLIIPFDEIGIANTWPVKSLNQVHFYNEGARAAILAVQAPKGE